MARKRIMEMLFAAAAAIIVAVGVTTTGAIAGSSADNRKIRLARPAAHSVVHDRRHLARRAFASRELVRGFGYAAPAYRWPGYVCVPGKGILDEACNLPTSACPNEMRDIQ
jgi:hypothetical protein